MNICMFTNTYLPHVGGVARSVSSITHDLRKAGHKVLVITPTFSGDDELDERHVVRVPAIQNFNGSDFSVRLPFPFVFMKKIEDFDPHIVHAHHPFLLGDAALRVSRRRKLPLAFTHHTLYEKYTHYVPLDSKTLQDFVIRLSSEYANLCTSVIAPSQSIARLIRGRGVARPIWVIPSGVDTDSFHQGDGGRFRQAHGISQDAVVVGHVGRLAPEKNLTYLAEAAALFLKAHSEARFLVIGAGPSREGIRRIFEEYGLSQQLSMPGEKTGWELADAYKAMDLFVFASKTETQGMVLTEAMAAGSPVIALNASGSREVVQDGINGRLLAADTPPEKFAAAMGDFLDNKEKGERWRNNARETAKAFSRRTCADKLCQMYESLVDEPVSAKEDVDRRMSSWDGLLEMIKAEWDLTSEKMKAALGTVTQGSVKSEHKDGP